MAEKLGEMGAALSSIHKAVKAAKTLHQKNGELAIIIDGTRKQADNIEDLQVPVEKFTVDQLKQAARKLRESGPELESVLQIFIDETVLFEKFVRTKILGSSIPTELMDDFCVALERMHGLATRFSNSFNQFFNRLSELQTTASNLTDKLKRMAQEQQQQADSRRNIGVAGTAGFVVAGVGLAALGFFTGGVAWLVAGVTAGAACGVGAGVVGYMTAEKVKEMRMLGDDILASANSMGVIAKVLKAGCDKAGVIKLDREAIAELKTALEFFKKKDEDRKDQKIAELEAKLSSLGH